MQRSMYALPGWCKLPPRRTKVECGKTVAPSKCVWSFGACSTHGTAMFGGLQRRIVARGSGPNPAASRENCEDAPACGQAAIVATLGRGVTMDDSSPLDIVAPNVTSPCSRFGAGWADLSLYGCRTCLGEAIKEDVFCVARRRDDEALQLHLGCQWCRAPVAMPKTLLSGPLRLGRPSMRGFGHNSKPIPRLER